MYRSFKDYKNIPIKEYIESILEDRVESVLHFNQLLKIVFLYRKLENRDSLIINGINNYTDEHCLSRLKDSDIEILKGMVKYFLNGDKRTSYHFVYGRIEEIYPFVSTENNHFIITGSKPNKLDFEITDITVTNNYKKLDLRNEFLIWCIDNSIYLGNMDTNLTKFRVMVEAVLSGEYNDYFNNSDRLSHELYISTEQLLLRKIDLGNYIFNGWIGDLVCLVSEV